ncbi:hypothetical protein LTR08_007594 [Meristemomyces frigidus]|nr:hypothetical protein LTR08_007594 [Meristemomyces frigidus]
MADPRVGVAVFVFNQTTTRFILGVRKGGHGAGTLALPGGHLEHGETFEQCAAREVKEETGLDVHHVRFCTATNSVFEGTGKHYVTIFMTALAGLEGDGVTEPEARLMEPDKCEGWQWLTFDDMWKLQGTHSELTGHGSLLGNNTTDLFQPLVDLMDQRPKICQSLQEMACELPVLGTY